MGEYFDYKVKFRNGNLLERLFQDGYLGPVDGQVDAITLDLQKMDEQNVEGEWFRETMPDNYQETTTFLRSAYHNNAKITIGKLENNDGIFYTNKWEPNALIPMALSKIYPNEVIEYEQSPTYLGHQGSTFYFKNGVYVNREGEEFIKGLKCINPKFIELVNPDTQMATVRIPVGTGRNKFGTFQVPAKNVSGLDGINNCVGFTEEPILVTFENGTVKEFSAAELVTKFWENIKAYKEYAREFLFLENVPMDRLIDKGEYYILTIHVPASVSQDGQLSTTIPESFVHENGTVYLGERMKEKNVQFMMEDRVQRKPMKIGDIKKLFDENEQDRSREHEGEEPDRF